jgi:GntR family transcriptional regulator/MocR family aminotransferase
LGRARAIACEPDDVTIVSGSQQAIDLIARVLVEPRDVVVLEDPGYPGAQRTFCAHGADVRGVPVDRDGLRVDLLRRLRMTVRLVYVTPSHQFPLGTVLAFPRRLELLRWADRTDAIIVEDDYDSAYRYEGRPIPALQGLDVSGRTIYVGTFSKTMFPALRLGYVVRCGPSSPPQKPFAIAIHRRSSSARWPTSSPRGVSSVTSAGCA